MQLLGTTLLIAARDEIQQPRGGPGKKFAVLPHGQLVGETRCEVMASVEAAPGSFGSQIGIILRHDQACHSPKRGLH